LFLDQFRNLLTGLLLAAAVLAGLIGDMGDMAAVLAVTLFNAVLGFRQERRAGRILDALKAMLAPTARVRRGGTVVEIEARHLVPGDLVLLGAGERIPADGRLVTSFGTEADESALTGESLPVAKDAATLSAAATPLAERGGMAYMNTVLTRGRAEMVVIATGGGTEMGRIATLLQVTEEGQTPLQRRLDRLGHRLAAIAVVVVAAVAAQGLIRGETLSDVVLTAVALAVAAIPEGLPAVVTVTLAIGMARMARRGAIVRRLAAVETLGSTTVICSDKTGTLTMNRMAVVEGWALGRRFTPDQAPAEALLSGVLCNDSRLETGEDGRRRAAGDPTEVALMDLALAVGAVPADGTWPRLAELPFDSATKLMATMNQGRPGVVRLSVKGAPGVVLDRCRTLRRDGGAAPLDAEGRAALMAEVERMAEGGLRVLVLASRDAVVGIDPAPLLEDLCLDALVGLADPPRPGVAEAIAACREAGIAVKMITGDHAGTGRAVAAAIGLEGRVVSGADLDGMDDARLAAEVEDIAVFARVRPEHKVRIVQALRARGHVVAMTGDGVNDAAALKSADMGIAMGRTGSDVTREAAAMVLTDDDFATVVGAVREGRTIAGNIAKFVRFQLATNMGALLAVVVAPLLGLPLPFGPIQILWVNIIMDGPPAMALAFDPPREGIMHDPPADPAASILPLSRLLRLAWLGGLMAAGTLAVFAGEVAEGVPLDTARTAAFTTFVLFQVFNVFNARVGEESALGRLALRNRKLWLALVGILVLQVVAVQWGPAQALFHTTALDLGHWGVALTMASSVLVAEEGRKLICRLGRSGPASPGAGGH